MKSKIWLFSYNNYFNRILKREETIEDYISASKDYAYINDVNFCNNDGINMSHPFNNVNIQNFDYLIETNNNDEIISRWFIIESTNTRNGQCNLQLHRDVLADEFENLLNVPMFVEKGYSNAENIAIYNKEDMQFNVIKQSETLLKDKTGVGWIVGFFAANTPDTSISVPSVKFNYASVQSLEAWDHYDAYQNKEKVVTGKAMSINVVASEELTAKINLYSTNTNEYDSQAQGVVKRKSGLSITRRAIFDEAISKFKSYAESKYDLLLEEYFDQESSYIEKTDLNNLDNTYLYDEDADKMYLVSVSAPVAKTTTATLNKASAASIGINNILQAWNDDRFKYDVNAFGNANIKVTINYDERTITLTEVSYTAFSTTISANANNLEDAPYKMFAIPYGSINVIYSTTPGDTGYTIDKIQALQLASKIAENLGSNLYDIQLLPYCPRTDLMSQYISRLILTRGTEHEDFELVKDGANKIGVVLYGNQSTFSFNILKNLPLSDDPIERKVEGQCNIYRLVSPNYASAFEFNLLKTGSISEFNVDCTYKPYNAYVHINPNWGALYGKDFNDCRGLIFKGDFTIPTVNASWTQYQINNASYQASFDRNIDSIELSNNYQAMSDTIRMFTGTISGGIAGASSGAIVGGGYGAIAGALIGTSAAAVGGTLDVNIATKLREDNLDRTIDQFKYSLRNIQALPLTLARVSTFDANNKIFPILEYYSCTDAEKELFKQKLEYNGMTIMYISTLSNFLSSERRYFKAKLIRCENIDGDYHYIQTINEELNAGVFIGG